jgi:hypothetical protein
MATKKKKVVEADTTIITPEQIRILEPQETIQGVRPEAADKVYEMLSKGRRYFGSAGASLTHQINNPDYDSEFASGVVRAGMEGERSTSKRIRKWMESVPNAVLIDSAHVKGMGKTEEITEDGIVNGGDTDHLLIIGNEVILIDSKRWKSKRKYSISDKGTVLRQGKNFPGGRVNAGGARAIWRKYLEDGAKVSSIVCINTERVFVQMDANWKKQPYRLITVEKLEEQLDYRYQRMTHQDRTTINSTIISQIAVSSIKPFDGYTRVFNMDTLKRFQQQ